MYSEYLCIALSKYKIFEAHIDQIAADVMPGMHTDARASTRKKLKTFRQAMARVEAAEERAALA